MKYCSACKLTRPTEEFGKNVSRRDGLECYCKACRKVARRRNIENDPCFYCGEYKDKMVVDHYMPLSRGGTEHWFNLVHACQACNGYKSNELPSDWEVENGISRSRNPLGSRVRN